MDYIIQSFDDYSSNGIIQILCKRINIVQDQTSDKYSPFYFGDIWDWMKKNKSKVPDYDYVKKYIDKTKSYSENTKMSPFSKVVYDRFASAQKND